MPSLGQRRAQLLEGKKGAGRRRHLGQAPRQRALVQVADAGGAELPERARQFRLHHALPGRERCPVRPGEGGARAGVGEERPGHGGEVGGEAAPDLGAEAGELLRRGHQLLEGPAGLAGVKREKAAREQGHGRGPVGAGRRGGAGAGREQHRFRGALVRVEDQAGAAAAQAHAGRQGHRQ